MRGRKPRPITLHPEDLAVLTRLVRSRTAPWFMVQRALALLAIAGGERVGVVAERLNCDPATVWRICRRYESARLESVSLLSMPRRKGGTARTPSLAVQPAVSGSDRLDPFPQNSNPPDDSLQGGGGPLDRAAGDCPLLAPFLRRAPILS